MLTTPAKRLLINKQQKFHDHKSANSRNTRKPLLPSSCAVKYAPLNTTNTVLIWGYLGLVILKYTLMKFYNTKWNQTFNCTCDINYLLQRAKYELERLMRTVARATHSQSYEWMSVSLSLRISGITAAMTKKVKIIQKRREVLFTKNLPWKGTVSNVTRQESNHSMELEWKVLPASNSGTGGPREKEWVIFKPARDQN